MVEEIDLLRRLIVVNNESDGRSFLGTLGICRQVLGQPEK